MKTPIQTVQARENDENIINLSPITRVDAGKGGYQSNAKSIELVAMGRNVAL